MNLKLKIYTKLIVSLTSLLSIGLVVFISINSSYYINKMSINNGELYNAYKVSELMKTYKSKIVSLDNNQKGYTITGDAKFIEQFKIKESELKTDLKSMEPFFEGTSEEQYFENLKELTYKKLSQLKDLNQQTNIQGFKNSRNDELESNTLDEISMALDEINISLSFHTKKLLDNSVEYLRASQTRSVIEIMLGVLVLLAGLVVLFRDINLRNELELELRKAKQQAEDNAHAKEQFMANMSHEIRTPMNSILGFSKLLDKTTLNEKQSEYLKSITNSGNNLLSIINDILDFSKIEAGKLHLEKINFSLHDLLSAIELMFYQKAQEKKIDFFVHKDNLLPARIFGDPTRLNQILVNLINNAIKFTQQGSVELNCEVKHIEHNLVTIVFRVKDSGIGIPKDKIDQVFERFNQGNKETTRKFGGTGLGLAIVKNLIEIQNGEIYVKSKEGFGSEFVVNLSFPLVFENAKTTEADTKFEYEKLAQGDKNILLVEDNALNQKLALEYLSEFGFLVDSALNGEEAIKKLSNNRYDLVLMDIQMPILDGYNTSKLIRNQLKLNLPIIAMT
ncbi:MAG: ATP-binding protein, partial [Bacteroidota bacterium]